MNSRAPISRFVSPAESLQAWKQEQGIEDERLTLKPEDLACASPIKQPGPSPRRVSPTATATSPSRSHKAVIEAYGLVERYGSAAAAGAPVSSPRPATYGC
jgi:hypothetical protein